MRKLLFVIIIALCGCGGEEKKQMSASDSLSAAIDSARASDTILTKLKNDTSTKNQTP